MMFNVLASVQPPDSYLVSVLVRKVVVVIRIHQNSQVSPWSFHINYGLHLR